MPEPNLLKKELAGSLWPWPEDDAEADPAPTPRGRPQSCMPTPATEALGLHLMEETGRQKSAEGHALLDQMPPGADLFRNHFSSKS